MRVNQLVAQYGEAVSIIRYYTSRFGDPFHEFNLIEIDARNDYYENLYTPHFIVDGIVDVGPAYEQWEDSVIQQFAVESPIAIDLAGTYDAAGRQVRLNIAVTAVDSIFLSDLRFQCAIVENDIAWDAPNGIKLHHQVMRDMVPDADGEPFAISMGETVYFERTATLDDQLAATNCQVVVFVQSLDTWEVLQSNNIKIANLAEPNAISVEMFPDNSPVIVPAGGSFGFAGALVNNTALAQNTDLWIVLDVPGYGIFGPIERINNIGLMPNDTLIVMGLTQHVPGYAPLGTYNYISYCGYYPAVALDFTSFAFEVTGGRVGGGYNDWALEGFSSDTHTSNIPAGVGLTGNYPNPFNATTTIGYELAVDGNVALDVYDLLGRKVATLLEGHKSAGKHSVAWDASGYASGMYFYRLSADREVITKRMTLLK